MGKFNMYRGAVCIAALMTGTSAMADLTAEQVWADWQENLTVGGPATVTTGNEETTDGTITITDLTLSSVDKLTSFTMTYPSIVFTENGDGTVNVTMNDDVAIEMDVDGGALDLTLFHTSLETVVSGTPEAIVYDTSADTYGLRVNSIDGVTGDMVLTANDLVSRTSYTQEEGGRDSQSDFTTRSIDLLLDIDFLLDVAPPNDDGTVTASGKMNGLAAQFGGFIPDNMDFANSAEFYYSSFDVSGRYGYDSADFIFDIDAPTAQRAGTVQSAGGSFDVAISAKAFSYESLTQDLAVTFESDYRPFPVNMKVAEYGARMAMPFGTTAEPAPFGLGITMSEVVMNDEIWDLADPSGTLARDPVTVLLDLNGTMKLLVGLLVPDQLASMTPGQIPAELYTLDLETLKIAMAGALIEGAGGFTFDNEDLTTFDGFPRPTGEINLSISGINGLMDDLVSIGLLPEDQAMMGRMMMGMFARSVGDDALESKIEINEEGHVLANGQRLQ